MPRLVVAGTASGVGKTTAVVALTRALRQRGLRVRNFKCGPDYLDPSYHARASGEPSENLDGWLMGRMAVQATFQRASVGSDVALIEGVMGLFDGADPTSDSGSTAEIAKWLSAPVLLVVDASGMARSIAALVQGYTGFDAELRVAGVLANRVGSRGHTDLLRRALATPPILGGLERAPEFAFAERHLGLHAADEQALPERVVEAWAERAREQCDLDQILSIARAAAPFSIDVSTPEPSRRTRCRIGLAHDAAFSFYYEDNLQRLLDSGAELVRFSPMAAARLPDVDGLYFGGGYPELHAAELAANRTMLADVRAFCASGRPVYAECGGLMYLSHAIRTLDGRRHALVGALPGEARMFPRLQALGYVEVQTRQASPLGPSGTQFRGHQFRYSELEGGTETPVYELRRRRGAEVSFEGCLAGGVLGSYVHAHWASNPAIAAAFVSACERFAPGRVPS
ncbi:MAG TPA: cobyrinate a,c-diamide synthase [Polyangiaceae bacterium]|nr:cobyrinate a,c-diamide synthase [Polyangiaceae bacterium]